MFSSENTYEENLNLFYYKNHISLYKRSKFLFIFK